MLLNKVSDIVNKICEFSFKFCNYLQGSDIQPQNQNTSSTSNVCMTDLSKKSFEKEENAQFTYEPELSVSENPYYYHVNEVLFEAHIQRLQRLPKVL